METERNFVVATDGSKKAVNAFRYSRATINCRL